jgi:hypothetical protein
MKKNFAGQEFSREIKSKVKDVAIWHKMAK